MVLSWTLGKYAAQDDVYFAREDFDSYVNDEVLKATEVISIKILVV